MCIDGLRLVIRTIKVQSLIVLGLTLQPQRYITKSKNKFRKLENQLFFAEIYIRILFIPLGNLCFPRQHPLDPISSTNTFSKFGLEVKRVATLFFP